MKAKGNQESQLLHSALASSMAHVLFFRVSSAKSISLLLQRRGGEVAAPNTWGIVGGEDLREDGHTHWFYTGSLEPNEKRLAKDKRRNALEQSLVRRSAAVREFEPQFIPSCG